MLVFRMVNIMEILERDVKYINNNCKVNIVLDKMYIMYLMCIKIMLNEFICLLILGKMWMIEIKI